MLHISNLLMNFSASGKHRKKVSLCKNIRKCHGGQPTDMRHVPRSFRHVFRQNRQPQRHAEGMHKRSQIMTLSLDSYRLLSGHQHVNSTKSNNNTIKMNVIIKQPHFYFFTGKARRHVLACGGNLLAHPIIRLSLVKYVKF